MVKYNIILVGDGGVGKTAFINMLRGNKFCYKYIPTMNIKKYNIMHNGHELCIIDTPGQLKYSPQLFGGHNVDCAIMMFVGKLSFNGLKHWHKIILLEYGNIPIIVCGNKLDLCNHKVSANMVCNYVNKNNLAYYSISAKQGHDYIFMLNAINKQISKIKSKNQSIYILDENKQTYQNTTIII